eukprot:2323793-Pleurochrysis_carterae.AAC.2
MPKVLLQYGTDIISRTCPAVRRAHPYRTVAVHALPLARARHHRAAHAPCACRAARAFLAAD